MQIQNIQLLKNNEHGLYFQTIYVNYKCPTLNMNHEYAKFVLLTWKVDIFDGFQTFVNQCLRYILRNGGRKLSPIKNYGDQQAKRI